MIFYDESLELDEEMEISCPTTVKKPGIHLKFAFKDAADAEALFGLADASHIVETELYDHGVRYVWKTIQSKDENDGMPEYELARQFGSFVPGSMAVSMTEFDYANWRLVRRRA